MPINEVTLSIPAFNLVCMRESGTTNTIDGNDIIRQVDINNIISQLGKSSISNPELKIVDIVPYEYILDNKEIHFESPVDKISKVSLAFSFFFSSDNIYIVRML